ncbi:MAG: DNA translocase FtsK 4TM domain-containing protein, partial [Kiritimatiellae bacterium]|nr:DNA translocase FtsK 4TM domain-containing protein [Kiritimatiellia bacterium]
MAEAANSRIQSTSANENSTRRKLIGFFLFPIALFPFLALISYRWQAIDTLNIPPEKSSNLIGVIGDTFAYNGYQLIGLATWAVAPLTLFLGLLLVLGRTFRPSRRFFMFLLFMFATTCLLQLLGDSPSVAAVLKELNLGSNAGGALGYLVMDCALSRLLSPFGASILMATLMMFALISMIGFKTILVGLGNFIGGKPLSPEEIKAKEDRKREAEERAQAIRAAKEAARAAKEAEKRKIAEERAAAKAAKEAEKDAARAAIEAAREAARAAKEAERRGEPAPVATAAVSMQSAPARPAAAAAVQSAPQTAAASQTSAPAAVDDEAEEVDKGPYLLPPLNLLNPLSESSADHGDVAAIGLKLIETLTIFGVEATLQKAVQGPVVTQYVLSLAPGTRPEKVESLQNTLMMAMKAKSLRIQAPIPGEDAVGIEMPNKTAAGVSFRELIESETWKKNTALGKNGQAKYNLPLLLGKDAAGHDLVSDLATMPHMLVAGATGQGKSVCLNSIINGLLMCRTPEQLKLIMVDPKCVEFTSYASLPHLLVPVITDTKKVVYSLRWAVAEMEKRLKMFARAGKRNIVDFNCREILTQPDMFGGADTGADDMPRTVPYIVIIIDEVADLMASAGKEVEPEIARLTAKARAAGIHVILATQRPDTKTITGTIKSNLPGRIAFKTSSSIDSRTILDATGAESLIGRGDMLFRTKEGILIRAQGAWVSDPEIGRITDFIAEHANVQFDKNFATKLARVKEAAITDPFADNEDDPDNAPK